MKRNTWFGLFPLLAIALATWAAVTGCNVFDSLDNPGNDAQYLSAARAAFDQGKFELSAEYYAKLSSEYADINASESAFRILDENGASMGAFMSSFGQKASNVGVSYTKLAGFLATEGGAPGLAKRKAIFEAYKKIDSIQANPELRGVIRFVASTALLAEVLAENASGLGTVTAGDLVMQPSNCLANGDAACVNPLASIPDCDIKTGKAFEDAGSAFRLSQETATREVNPAAEAEIGAVRPNYHMVQALLQEIDYALSSEIIAAGDLGGNTESFTGDFLAAYGLLLETSPDCYRFGLLVNGIGAAQ